MLTEEKFIARVKYWLDQNKKYNLKLRDGQILYNAIDEELGHSILNTELDPFYKKDIKECENFCNWLEKKFNEQI